MGADMLVPALAGEEWAASHGEAVAATEGALFGELIHDVAALPGARAFLETLRERGHPAVLSSSAKQGDLDVYLDLLGARELVDAWTVADDVERTKPSPEIVYAALEKLGDVDGGVMVGDSVHDVAAAHGAGLPTIAVLTGGFGAQELLDAGAECVFEDLLELLRRLDDTPLA